MNGLTFSDVLYYIKDGRRVQREGWNGPNQFLELQRVDEHSKMTRDYIYITTAQGDRIPWVASQSDLLADDWREVFPSV